MLHYLTKVTLNSKTENNVSFLPQKNSINRFTLFTLFEKLKTRELQNNNNVTTVCKIYKHFLFAFLNYDLKKRLAINLVFRDMIHNYKMWRHVRGYPVNGQRTWSNGKSVSKNNLLFKNFRIHQIVTAYGKKRKNKASQLVSGEYVNKLWLKTWKSEWKQARKFNLKSARGRGKKNTIFIDLKSLVSCITGGYKRKGQARRFNKAKKRFKNITVGLPLFFTRYIYTKVKDKKFLVDFSLMHEQRKMKSRKRVKKKIVIKKKKKKNKLMQLDNKIISVKYMFYFNKIINYSDKFNMHLFLIYKLCFQYANFVSVLSKKNNINFFKLYKPIKKKIKKKKTIFYLSFFMLNSLKNEFNISLLKLHHNKFYCFWPILRKKKSTYSLYFNLIKKLKKSTNKFKKKLSKFIKNEKYNNKLLFKIWSFFSKKKNNKKNKGYFFNFHRRQIKIFWKSQEVFKSQYLRKCKYTTRKFKNKFDYWFKKNKKINKNVSNTLLSIISKNFLFFSISCLQKIFQCGVFFKNGFNKLTLNSQLHINDILSLPLNFVDFVPRFVVGKFKSLKIFKKKNYIFMKNKTSQWKNIKRKPTKELNFDLYSINKIDQTLEFDVYSGQMAYIKKSEFINPLENVSIRHNLEKLNTYKLNV